MSFAADILKKINYVPEEVVKVEKTSARLVQHSAAPNKPAAYVKTARGPMRTGKNGKIDGRSLRRGIPKERKNKEPTSFEHILLRDIFENAKPGEEFAWDWRTESTYSDIKLRGAQLTYAYKIADVYGHKVSLSARPSYMVIKYVGSKA